mgnify:CR=1 FL=1
MLNKNPLWRYILVPGLLLLALLYALPNLYPEDPALNISASRGGVLTEQTRQQLQHSFTAQGITAKSVELSNGQLLARKLPLQQLIVKAAELSVISAAEATQLNDMNELRFDAISVDSFKPGELEALAIKG